ncbi:hypothetical protein AB1Y20_012218 [Prymnesium parvum]|uniref:RNA helicase n=1 Tax=Prymnesium parvum TaxID=97485 RepID=A0AB34IPY4_PRYPA
MPLPAGWEPKLDHTTGNVYFWNTSTNAVTWERPTELADERQQSHLLLQQAAAAGAEFVRCLANVGEVSGYEFQEGSDGTGYYRRADAPPPDDKEYARCVLARASAAGAEFVACANDVGEVQGYAHRDGPEGRGYYLLPGQRDVACESAHTFASRPNAPAAATRSSKEDISKWLKLHNVQLSEGCPPPLLTFEEALFPPSLMDEIQRAGFHMPSPIQSAAWSAAMAGRDLVAIARTGSGKTLGYLAPAILKLESNLAMLVRDAPSVLVLAPTRELALQIHAEAERFGGSSAIVSVALYGGAPREAQAAKLERGVHVVVATPGRLYDFINSGQVELDEVQYVVLDEADRMLDMGFEPQIREVLKQVPRDRRQMLMFSATWPEEVRVLAAKLLREPCKVTIGGSGGSALVANHDVEQRIIFTPSESQREAELIKQIKLQPAGARVIVFCSTKKTCAAVSRALRRHCSCGAIHGDKEQKEREKALADFRSGALPVLVATDVAARGLDIKDVQMVVNYEMPQKIEDYVHRIGRTGRAGAKGHAVSFMSAADAFHAPALIKILQDAKQTPPAELRKMAAIMGHAAGKPTAAASSSSSSTGRGLYD